VAERQPSVERVRGTLDVLPDESAALEEIQASLARTFERYGYRRITLPVLEHADLYLRKSGPDIISKLYSFEDRGGRLVALRPELTASAVRAYVAQGAALPLPVRWYMGGPAFRYEKPQRGRYRQFTMMGVELLGAPPPLADAEVIALAAHAADDLGLRGYRIVIGHIGILLELFAGLEVSARVQHLLLESLEDLTKPHRGMPFVRSRFARLLGDGQGNPAPDPTDGTPTAALDQPLDQAAAHALARQLLARLRGGAPVAADAGSRDPDDIVRRLLRKLSGTDSRARIERALAFIEELSRLEGPPQSILPEFGHFLERHNLSQRTRAELEELCVRLEDFGVNGDRVALDLSLGRGLQYYTGIVFELYYHGLGAEQQICGGGRYDGLAQALGAPGPLPALGFSFGVERLKLALDLERRAWAGAGTPEVLLVPLPGAEGYAIRAAEQLRAAGMRVELEVRGRTVRAAADCARRSGIPWVAVAGPDEAAAGMLSLRRSESSEPAQRYGVSAVVAVVRGRADEPVPDAAGARAGT
jgi:histidyl-tRNA synthetase